MEGYKYVQNEKGVIVPKISDSTSETWGLVQRCARVMVDEVERAKKHRNITISVSFLEIYNEHIYDLLNSALFRRKQAKSPQPGDPLLITIPFNSAQMDPSGLKLKWNNNDHYIVENLFTFEC